MTTHPRRIEATHATAARTDAVARAAATGFAPLAVKVPPPPVKAPTPPKRPAPPVRRQAAPPPAPVVELGGLVLTAAEVTALGEALRERDVLLRAVAAGALDPVNELAPTDPAPRPPFGVPRAVSARPRAVFARLR